MEDKNLRKILNEIRKILKKIETGEYHLSEMTFNHGVNTIGIDFKVAFRDGGKYEKSFSRKLQRVRR